MSGSNVPWKNRYRDTHGQSSGRDGQRPSHVDFRHALHGGGGNAAWAQGMIDGSNNENDAGAVCSMCPIFVSEQVLVSNLTVNLLLGQTVTAGYDGGPVFLTPSNPTRANDGNDGAPRSDIGSGVDASGGGHEGWWQVNFGVPVDMEACQVLIDGGNGTPGASWLRLSASTNGSSWVTIVAQADFVDAAFSDYNMFVPGTYQYWRLTYTTQNGFFGGVSLGEWKMYGAQADWTTPDANMFMAPEQWISDGSTTVLHTRHRYNTQSLIVTVNGVHVPVTEGDDGDETVLDTDLGKFTLPRAYLTGSVVTWTYQARSNEATGYFPTVATVVDSNIEGNMMPYGSPVAAGAALADGTATTVPHSDHVHTVAAGIVSYDNTTSHLVSTNVQGAIDELGSRWEVLMSDDPNQAVPLYDESSVDWLYGTAL